MAQCIVRVADASRRPRPMVSVDRTADPPPGRPACAPSLHTVDCVGPCSSRSRRSIRRRPPPTRFQARPTRRTSAAHSVNTALADCGAAAPLTATAMSTLTTRCRMKSGEHLSMWQVAHPPRTRHLRAPRWNAVNPDPVSWCSHDAREPRRQVPEAALQGPWHPRLRLGNGIWTKMHKQRRFPHSHLPFSPVQIPAWPLVCPLVGTKSWTATHQRLYPSGHSL